MNAPDSLPVEDPVPTQPEPPAPTQPLGTGDVPAAPPAPTQPLGTGDVPAAPPAPTQPLAQTQPLGTGDVPGASFPAPAPETEFGARLAPPDGMVAQPPASTPGPAAPPAAEPAAEQPAPRSGPASEMLLLGAPTSPAPAPAAPPEPVGPPCAECGAGFDPDGYCLQCGARRPDPRQHYVIDADWVAGVCDRGIRHLTNEDALALRADPRPAAQPPTSPETTARACLVVSDGVSTARRSAQASQAAADAALATLSASRSRGLAGSPSALVGALAGQLDAAVDAANAAVLEVAAAPQVDEPAAAQAGQVIVISDPACTLVAAVVDGDAALVGSVGDSRAYWIPDSGEPLLLTSDDSWAQTQVERGVDRAVAEAGPHAHTISRWLGPDAPDHTPRKTALSVGQPGWLLLCTDGLWNYASGPDELAAVVGYELTRLHPPARPLDLADRLVAWANAQGGRDNITVALARVDLVGPPEPHAAGLDPEASASTTPPTIALPVVDAARTEPEGPR